MWVFDHCGEVVCYAFELFYFDSVANAANLLLRMHREQCAEGGICLEVLRRHYSEEHRVQNNENLFPSECDSCSLISYQKSYCACDAFHVF
jgi:hypothetical protein